MTKGSYILCPSILFHYFIWYNRDFPTFIDSDWGYILWFMGVGSGYMIVNVLINSISLKPKIKKMSVDEFEDENN